MQAELAESTRRGGLANDAYGRVIEAQSAAIGVFPDFVDAVKSAQPQFTPVHIEEITAGLAKAVNPTVVNAVQHLHWKFPAAFFASALALIVAAGAWGYHFGYSTGYYVSQNALIDIPVGSEVGARLPAPEAEKWAALMRSGIAPDCWRRPSCIGVEQRLRRTIMNETEWFFAPADCGNSRVDVNRRIIQSCPHSRGAASAFLVPARPG